MKSVLEIQMKSTFGCLEQLRFLWKIITKAWFYFEWRPWDLAGQTNDMPDIFLQISLAIPADVGPGEMPGS